jgi:mono/diheme cytochrome c family protein
MKRKTIIGAVVALGVVGIGFAFWMMWRPEIAAVSPPQSAGKETLDRGRRIVEAGDCAVCHTRPGGDYMAGGLPLITPFGTLFTTNITPDPETGIGKWSLPAFERAMREGIARDGHFLYPAFPYVHYRKLSGADIADAYAFLMSVDPVKYTAPENHMVFPDELPCAGVVLELAVPAWRPAGTASRPVCAMEPRTLSGRRRGTLFVLSFAAESDWWRKEQRAVQRRYRRRLDGPPCAGWPTRNTLE